MLLFNDEKTNYRKDTFRLCITINEQMKKLQMVDLVTQYKNIQSEIDQAVLSTLQSGAYINGQLVNDFATHLGDYLDSKYVIPCGNGTDALQIAYMALGLQPGDEVIIPDFTYVAPAEAALLLGLTPVFVDVDASTFNIDTNQLEAAVSSRTKAIVAVHLFGQCCDMDLIEEFAERFQLSIVEDNAQSIGCKYQYKNGEVKRTGTMGRIGCLSFFPSKNLGAYGDGGAVLTQDEELAKRIRMIANHGQQRKYYHDRVGVNSRLDTLQAAILDVKLRYLDSYIESRNRAAAIYDRRLAECHELSCPEVRFGYDHVYHQYTLKVEESQREPLVHYLSEQGIPTMVYYPLPLHQQKVFANKCRTIGNLSVSAQLSKRVLSLPMHTELTEEMQHFICDAIIRFFRD